MYESHMIDFAEKIVFQHVFKKVSIAVGSLIFAGG